jgi:hypothetical protein
MSMQVYAAHTPCTSQPLLHAHGSTPSGVTAPMAMASLAYYSGATPTGVCVYVCVLCA